MLHFERNPVEIHRDIAPESRIWSRDPTGRSNKNRCRTSCWFQNVKPEVNRFINGLYIAFLLDFPIITQTGNSFVFDRGLPDELIFFILGEIQSKFTEIMRPKKLS